MGNLECNSENHIAVGKIKAIKPVKAYKNHLSIEAMIKLKTKRENFDIPFITTEKLREIIEKLVTVLDKILPKMW